MNKLNLKTDHEIKIMAEGGKKLAEVKNKLKEAVKEGVTAHEVDSLANNLIAKTGGEASFKKVPGYSWATCVNVNEGLVHGIPTEKIVFKKGDVVSVDIGLYYQGFHTDTSFTIAIDPLSEIENFLKTGEEALKKAIEKARVENYIYDISNAIEKTIETQGYSTIHALVGHGVGRELHEEPPIPCFTKGYREESPKITEGMVLAIEVMYTKGSPEVGKWPDGWTISMRDGKISALFEETVAVNSHGPIVLTA